MKKFLALALATLLSTGVFAQNIDEDAVLKNYVGVTNLLRMNGVEPASVRWNDVEMMCSFLQDNKNPVPYNRCRFEKARDQIFYRGDAKICNDESKAFDSNSVFYQEFFSTNVGGMQVVGTTVPVVTPTVADKRAFRRYMYDRCMQEKGWKNARTYKFGRD